MAEPRKCANAPCACMVESHGPFGKYCSDHCKQVGDRITLRCECEHDVCRQSR